MQKHLDLASEKTESVVLKGKRDYIDVNLKLRDVNVNPSKAVKYLSIVLRVP